MCSVISPFCIRTPPQEPGCPTFRKFCFCSSNFRTLESIQPLATCLFNGISILSKVLTTHFRSILSAFKNDFSRSRRVLSILVHPKGNLKESYNKPVGNICIDVYVNMTMKGSRNFLGKARLEKRSRALVNSVILDTFILKRGKIANSLSAGITCNFHGFLIRFIPLYKRSAQRRCLAQQFSRPSSAIMAKPSRRA